MQAKPYMAHIGLRCVFNCIDLLQNDNGVPATDFGHRRSTVYSFFALPSHLSPRSSPFANWTMDAVQVVYIDGRGQAGVGWVYCCVMASTASRLHKIRCCGWPCLHTWREQVCVCQIVRVRVTRRRYILFSSIQNSLNWPFNIFQDM